jgi:hypothetical protein
LSRRHACPEATGGANRRPAYRSLQEGEHVPLILVVTQAPIKTGEFFEKRKKKPVDIGGIRFYIL